MPVATEWVVRWSERCIKAWWRLILQLGWHTWRTLLLRWRRETLSTLSIAGHDALEEVRRAMAYGGRRLRWAGMWTLWCTATLLKFVSKASYLGLIATEGCE